MEVFTAPALPKVYLPADLVAHAQLQGLSCFWCFSADGCGVVLVACLGIRNVTLHKYVTRSVQVPGPGVHL